MTTTYKKKLVPQTEEGIEKVCWKDEAEAKELVKNSYKNIQLVLGVRDGKEFLWFRAYQNIRKAYRR